jgi:hypothetical protein
MRSNVIHQFAFTEVFQHYRVNKRLLMIYSMAIDVENVKETCPVKHFFLGSKFLVCPFVCDLKKRSH